MAAKGIEGRNKSVPARTAAQLISGNASGYRYAGIPVTRSPITSAWIWSVPS